MQKANNIIIYVNKGEKSKHFTDLSCLFLKKVKLNMNSKTLYAFKMKKK